MRRWLLVPLLAISLNVCAAATLRVGQQVLSVGDTASKVSTLLGKPDFKEPVQNKFGAYLGERWQYNREQDRVVTVTLISGKVADIEDRHN
jgi:hypothetical protein